MSRSEEIATGLREFVAAESAASSGSAQTHPDGPVEISNLRRLAGGASRELWSLELDLGQGVDAVHHELVLRLDPPGRVGEGDRSLEFQVLRVAGEAGVPVPRVHWCCTDPRVLGSSFFLMDRIEGETIPRRLLRDDDYAKTRMRATSQMGEILAGIHAIDPAHADLTGLASSTAGVGTARDEIQRIADGVRALAVEPHPVLDLVERWLLEQAPEPERRVLVHGDFRVGNFVFDRDGIVSVLDWELAHLGDPIEDLGWACVRAWRFGNDRLEVGGVGTRDELVASYEAAGGGPVDRQALRFWEACGNFKLALVFISQARVFLDGVASVELASLGRRIAEAEQELLALMDDRADAMGAS